MLTALSHPHPGHCTPSCPSLLSLPHHPLPSTPRSLHPLLSLPHHPPSRRPLLPLTPSSATSPPCPCRSSKEGLSLQAARLTAQVEELQREIGSYQDQLAASQREVAAKEELAAKRAVQVRQRVQTPPPTPGKQAQLASAHGGGVVEIFGTKLPNKVQSSQNVGGNQSQSACRVRVRVWIGRT